jgi:16S rRNA (guanine966-N2)-methyltransferase
MPRKPSPSKSAPGRVHRVRIIGGQWKRTLLPVLDAEGLRPTPDRVRETVFNWLGHLFDGAWEEVACLDLFAGTGVLGFEAASRGAAHVVMVESHTPAVKQLQITRDKLQAARIEILRGDAFAMARGMQRRFDLIFLDPPYQKNWLEKMLPLCKGLLAEGGFVYAESEVSLASETPPDWLADWEIVRADSAGMVYYHLLQAKTA